MLCKSLFFSIIYKLIESRKTMWNRLEQLEDMQKDPSRLFSNRGGMLLMEEKERKKIQKVSTTIRCNIKFHYSIIYSMQ